MSVRYVKLNNGEDFVADVEQVTDDDLLIKVPVRFMLSPEGVAAIPYLPFCKGKEFKIKSNLIMLMDEVDTELYNAYKEKFGTGILLSAGNLKLSD